MLLWLLLLLGRAAFAAAGARIALEALLHAFLDVGIACCWGRCEELLLCGECNVAKPHFGSRGIGLCDQQLLYSSRALGNSCLAWTDTSAATQSPNREPLALGGLPVTPLHILYLLEKRHSPRLTVECHSMWHRAS